MKNKLLIAAVIILAFVVIFENAYLLGRYSVRGSRTDFCMKNRDKKICGLKPDYKRDFYPQKPIQHPIQTKALQPPVYSINEIPDPFSEMEKIHERANRIFSESFSQAPRIKTFSSDGFAMNSSMSFDSQQNAYIIKIDMPGISKDDLKIQIKENKIVISAEDKKDIKNEGSGFYKSQSSYNSFTSEFVIPQDAQISAITKDYKDGALILTIPRFKKDKVLSMDKGKTGK